MFKILLAEDDQNLNRLIEKNLTRGGYEVITCFNGEQALKSFGTEKVDILVTDIMMPKMDGNTLIKEIKAIKSDFPVIMLTALDDIISKKKSFLGGADDYMTKPVDYEELLLRISALLRRYQIVNQKNILHGNVTLQYDAKCLLIDNKNIELTKKEFLLLYMLMASPGRIYSRAQILDEIWGFDSDSFERTVDVHVNKIREKTLNSSVEITTVRGLGYKAILKV